MSFVLLSLQLGYNIVSSKDKAAAAVKAEKTDKEVKPEVVGALQAAGTKPGAAVGSLQATSTKPVVPESGGRQGQGGAIMKAKEIGSRGRGEEDGGKSLTPQSSACGSASDPSAASGSEIAG